MGVERLFFRLMSNFELVVVAGKEPRLRASSNEEETVLFGSGAFVDFDEVVRASRDGAEFLGQCLQILLGIQLMHIDGVRIIPDRGIGEAETLQEEPIARDLQVTTTSEKAVYQGTVTFDNICPLSEIIDDTTRRN